jgi:hypothetical protein
VRACYSFFFRKEKGKRTMADDRARDERGRFVSRKRAQPEPEPVPERTFQDGPGTYDFIPHLIAAFQLRPGWTYVDKDIPDRRPVDPNTLTDDWRKRRVPMGLSGADVVRIRDYLSSMRAVSRAWKDAADRALQNKEFGLLLAQWPIPTTISDCIELIPMLPSYFSNADGRMNAVDTRTFTAVLNNGICDEWVRIHGAPAFDAENNSASWNAVVNRDRRERSLLEGRYQPPDASSAPNSSVDSAHLQAMDTARKPPLSASDVRHMFLGPQQPGQPARQIGEFYESYKLLDDDVFLRQYLGLSEEDMTELNRDVREVSRNFRDMHKMHKDEEAPTKEHIRWWILDRIDNIHLPATAADLKRGCGFDDSKGPTKWGKRQLEACYKVLNEDKELREHCKFSDEEMAQLEYAVRSIGPDFAARNPHNPLYGYIRTPLGPLPW